MRLSISLGEASDKATDRTSRSFLDVRPGVGCLVYRERHRRVDGGGAVRCDDADVSRGARRAIGDRERRCELSPIGTHDEVARGDASTCGY